MLNKETEIRQVNANDQTMGHMRHSAHDQKMGHMRHNAHTNISQAC